MPTGRVWSDPASERLLWITPDNDPGPGEHVLIALDDHSRRTAPSEAVAGLVIDRAEAVRRLREAHAPASPAEDTAPAPGLRALQALLELDHPPTTEDVQRAGARLVDSVRGVMSGDPQARREALRAWPALLERARGAGLPVPEQADGALEEVMGAVDAGALEALAERGARVFKRRADRLHELRDRLLAIAAELAAARGRPP